MLKVLFIDRDGTLIEEPADFQVDALEKIRLVPGVFSALQRLRDIGYRFVMVSNQDGLGTASFPQEKFEICQAHTLALFESQGIRFDEIFICPHLPEDGCDCRKPGTALLTQYLASNALDIDACAVIGDRETDIELAEALGMKGFRIGDEESSLAWEDIVRALTPGARTAEVSRTTLSLIHI